MSHYIAVEGLIGVGKSTLCRLMRDEWGARLVMEPDATNPFLESYYRDSERYALPVQMYYLIGRWRQQQQIRQPDLFQDLVVSDYIFAKDRMFAEKTLPEDELALYDQFARALGETAPTPDLLIYLHAPLDVLFQRIATRAVPGEEEIDPSYLVDLAERYERLLAQWDGCPVLRLDNRDMNYARDPSARQAVLETIHQALLGQALPSAPGSEESDREVQTSLFEGAGSRSNNLVQNHRVGPSQEEGR